LIALEWSLIKI